MPVELPEERREARELRRTRRLERIAERPEASAARPAPSFLSVPRAASRSATRCPCRASQSAGSGAQPPPSSGTRSSPSCQARMTAAASARFGARLAVAPSLALVELALEDDVVGRRPPTEPRAKRALREGARRASPSPVRFCHSRSFAAKRIASVPSRSTRRPGTRFSSSRRRRSTSRSSSRRRVGTSSPSATIASPSTRATRRIAVHERGQDRQRVSLVREVHLDARARVGRRAREPVRRD